MNVNLSTIECHSFSSRVRSLNVMKDDRLHANVMYDGVIRFCCCFFVCFSIKLYANAQTNLTI